MIAAASQGPTFDSFAPVITLLWQATVAALAMSFLVALIAAVAARKNFFEALTFVAPFGWLGTVAGLIAGSTKEAIVGALLTGMLTIVGAMLSYAFSKESLAEWRKLLPFSVILLSAGALAGLSIGQVNRSKYEAFDREYTAWLVEYQNVDVPAMAARVRHSDCVARIAPASKDKCDALLTQYP